MSRSERRLSCLSVEQGLHRYGSLVRVSPGGLDAGECFDGVLLVDCVREGGVTAFRDPWGEVGITSAVDPLGQLAVPSA